MDSTMEHAPRSARPLDKRIPYSGAHTFPASARLPGAQPKEQLGARAWAPRSTYQGAHASQTNESHIQERGQTPRTGAPPGRAEP